MHLKDLVLLYKTLNTLGLEYQKDHLFPRQPADLLRGLSLGLLVIGEEVGDYQGVAVVVA